MESLKTSYHTYIYIFFFLKPTDNVSQGFLQQKSHNLFVRRQTLSCGMQNRDGIEIIIAPHRKIHFCLCVLDQSERILFTNNQMAFRFYLQVLVL